MSNYNEHELLSGANPDVTPLGDDELDLVAGGTARSDAKAAAKADGRTHRVGDKAIYKPTCSCRNIYRWARTKKKVGSSNIDGSPYYEYLDCKCYDCGKTFDRIAHHHIK